MAIISEEEIKALRKKLGIVLEQTEELPQFSEESAKAWEEQIRATAGYAKVTAESARAIRQDVFNSISALAQRLPKSEAIELLRYLNILKNLEGSRL